MTEQLQKTGLTRCFWTSKMQQNQGTQFEIWYLLAFIFQYIYIYINGTLPGPYALMNPSAWSTTKCDCPTDLGETRCRDLFTPYVFIKLKMKLCGYKSSLEFSNMLLKDSTLVPAAMCLCNVQREAVTRSLDHTDTETVFSQQSFCRSNTYRHIKQTAHRYSVINQDKTTYWRTSNLSLFN